MSIICFIVPQRGTANERGKIPALSRVGLELISESNSSVKLMLRGKEKEMEEEKSIKQLYQGRNINPAKTGLLIKR